MRVLSRRERTFVSGLGCAVCVIALSLLPRNAGALAFPAGPLAVPVRPASAIMAAPDAARVSVARDPFVSDVDSLEIVPLANLPVLPPNRGISAAPLDVQSAVTVRAVVSGAHAFALVESGQQTLVLKAGDSLAGSRVATIDTGGISLSDGRRLSLGSPAR